MRSTLWRALVLSLVLGGLFPLIYSSFNCLSVEYRTPMDPAAFYALSYEKQQEWLRENEVRVTGTKCVGQRFLARHFWEEYFAFAFYGVGLLFVGCLLMVRWERSRPHVRFGPDGRPQRDDTAP